jgi:hypothetical protein
VGEKRCASQILIILTLSSIDGFFGKGRNSTPLALLAIGPSRLRSSRQINNSRSTFLGQKGASDFFSVAGAASERRES